MLGRVSKVKHVMQNKFKQSLENNGGQFQPTHVQSFRPWIFKFLNFLFYFREVKRTLTGSIIYLPDKGAEDFQYVNVMYVM